MSTKNPLKLSCHGKLATGLHTSQLFDRCFKFDKTIVSVEMQTIKENERRQVIGEFYRDNISKGKLYIVEQLERRATYEIIKR